MSFWASLSSAKAKHEEIKIDLPLPPKCIRLVLFDMDQTLLSTHTGGCFRGRLDDLALKVVPAFIHIVPKLIANNILVGIVTFSDALMRAPGTTGYAGEALVVELLQITFAAYFAQTVPTATKQQTQKMANDMVASISVAAAFPQIRNLQAEYQKPFPAMPNSKFWHIEQVKASILARTGETIQNDTIMLFDDSEPNVKEAAVTKVHAFGVDRKTGFTSKDWLEGVSIVKAREANPTIPITAVVISGAKATAAATLKPVNHAPPPAHGSGTGPAAAAAAAAATNDSTATAAATAATGAANGSGNGIGLAAGLSLPPLTTSFSSKPKGPPTPHPPNSALQTHQPPSLLISPRYSITDGQNSSTSTIHSLPPTPHAGNSYLSSSSSSSATAAAAVSSSNTSYYQHSSLSHSSSNSSAPPAGSAGALGAALLAAAAAAAAGTGGNSPSPLSNISETIASAGSGTTASAARAAAAARPMSASTRLAGSQPMAGSSTVAADSGADSSDIGTGIMFSASAFGTGPISMTSPGGGGAAADSDSSATGAMSDGGTGGSASTAAAAAAAVNGSSPSLYASSLSAGSSVGAGSSSRPPLMMKQSSNIQIVSTHSSPQSSPRMVDAFDATGASGASGAGIRSLRPSSASLSSGNQVTARNASGSITQTSPPGTAAGPAPLWNLSASSGSGSSGSSGGSAAAAAAAAAATATATGTASAFGTSVSPHSNATSRLSKLLIQHNHSVSNLNEQL